MPVLVLVLVLEQVPVLALVLEQVPVLVPVLVLPAHLVLDVQCKLLAFRQRECIICAYSNFAYD